MSVITFDLSLTATGWAGPDGSGVLLPPAGVGKGVERLRWIRDAVLELAAGADLVVLEGYSFASKGRAVVSIGELGGVVRLALHEAGLPVVEVSPSSRAKYATGKGNASKDQVLVEAVRRLDYAGHSHDEADALWLRCMALDALDLPGRVDVPKVNRTALAGVDWPQVGELVTA
jgi:crossover junction endodeoxyribonuclease RuvC